MLIKIKFKPNEFYLSFLNNLKKIKTTEPVTPRDVVIASICNIKEITDYHKHDGLYKK